MPPQTPLPQPRSWRLLCQKGSVSLAAAAVTINLRFVTFAGGAEENNQNGSELVRPRTTPNPPHSFCSFVRVAALLCGRRLSLSELSSIAAPSRLCSASVSVEFGLSSHCTALHCVLLHRHVNHIRDTCHRYCHCHWRRRQPRQQPSSAPAPPTHALYHPARQRPRTARCRPRHRPPPSLLPHPLHAYHTVGQVVLAASRACVRATAGGSDTVD